MMKKIVMNQSTIDVEFLHSIQRFQWTTTNQLTSYIGHHSKRNILRKLEQLSPYLHIIQHPSRHIYGLNTKGGELLGMPHATILTDLQEIYDVVFRNDVWEWCGYPEWHWQEELLPASKKEPLIPDAYWYQGQRLYVVEIDTGDNMYQTLRNMWRYRGLVKQSERRGKPVPHVYYVTTDAIRSAWLEEALGGHKPWLQCVNHIKKGGSVR
ncbi:hypothetical protein JDS99_29815 [Bacillus cereus group sp. N6]|uniref:replication-relaxation family protein n=1 Tax=Bacillus cereus group sp. N6 TaxID=2794583 RepID=UPI0018F3F32B|nr:hypothetical protein [Bacillus cereus group sp. N6]MBJ8113720.1 hypothetical protein [Bacillus cereus group sp. N6]